MKSVTMPKNDYKQLKQLKNWGSVFLLATHDLEIRGAGELLGEAQKWADTKIGFSLFKDMLADAIKSLRSEKHLDHEEKATDININIPVLIPEELI